MKYTEQRNPCTTNIDKMSTAEMLRVLQAENKKAVNCLDRALPDIEKAVEEAYKRMKNGGRLFYVGCGTSGRLGVLDASECPPTYGVSPDLVVGIIAGGDSALRKSSEGKEDSFEEGKKDIEKYFLTCVDTVVAISASGGAKYILGALNAAKEKGCLTVGICSCDDSELFRATDINIFTDTGAEPITGSTRMKAGTAQKLVLNMLSTSLMVKLGYVYENLMINLKPTNIKLRARMISIVCDITGQNPEEAEKLLCESDWNIRKAVNIENKFS